MPVTSVARAPFVYALKVVAPVLEILKSVVVAVAVELPMEKRVFTLLIESPWIESFA